MVKVAMKQMGWDLAVDRVVGLTLVLVSGLVASCRGKLDTDAQTASTLGGGHERAARPPALGGDAGG